MRQEKNDLLLHHKIPTSDVISNLMSKKNSIYTFIQYFCENIGHLIKLQPIQFYLKILGLNIEYLRDDESHLWKNHLDELDNLVRQFMKYPSIVTEICAYLQTGKSKIDFLSQLSEEQFRYVTCLKIDNTRLIACAGSGKTRCILARIKFLVEHGMADKNDIYAITFSEAAALDFKSKIRHLFPNCKEFCNLSNLSTIDSLAKSILCRVRPHKSDNVSILSAAFRNYLRDIETTEDRDIFRSIKNIRHLFVDEAQDLNQTQYDIIHFLQTKFGTHIHLIGDPNQNIYQFRSSSATFLINHPSRQFDLTLNYRSTQEIINFSSCFKQIATKPSVSATGKTGNSVVVITKPTNYILNLILRFIKIYEKEEDISEIALICPTRGTGTYKKLGLAILFNFLKTNGISVNQQYSETGQNEEKIKKTGKIPGHLNLLTYHGTKGLEFKVVFVMDFYHHLFNIRPTFQDHEDHRYLLYVATSRACDLMYVCVYNDVHGGYLNHWLSKVPSSYYFTDTRPIFPVLDFRNKRTETIRGITELIYNLSDIHLDKIHDWLTITEDSNTGSRRIYRDFTHVNRGKDESLFGIFVEELFYLQYHLSRKINPRILPMIEMLLESRTIIIETESEYEILRKFIRDNNMTWQRFDLERTFIPERIQKLVDKYLSRDCELTRCILCTNEFMQIVELNLVDIRESYEKYLNVKSYNYDYRKILDDFFYLIVVQYAYDINHYFYINNHGMEKQYLLQSGYELFEDINTYVQNNYHDCNLKLKQIVYYPKLSINGEMDFIESYTNPSTEIIVEVKCVKEINMAFYIQLLLYNFCYYHDTPNKSRLYHNKFKILNLLTGLEHSFAISIDPENMFNLFIILAETGNLIFRDLNLVLDLETSGLIHTEGPFDYRPTNTPRVSIQRRGEKYFALAYPEIIEIAIRDYDTDMILINTLVRPKHVEYLDPKVMKLTRIIESMLMNKPDIDDIRDILNKKFKLFVNTRILAHNGSHFDNQILIYDKLVDKSRTTFIDTQNLIASHFHVPLKSKSLANIYQLLFQKDFRGHRALEDVDALIKIMRKLAINI